MAIPAMALLQQHDARRDILIEPAACSDRSSGHSELGAQSGRKNQPACLCMCVSLQRWRVKCMNVVHACAAGC